MLVVVDVVVDMVVEVVDVVVDAAVLECCVCKQHVRSHCPAGTTLHIPIAATCWQTFCCSKSAVIWHGYVLVVVDTVDADVLVVAASQHARRHVLPNNGHKSPAST
jgi:hypothetical protein